MGLEPFTRGGQNSRVGWPPAGTSGLAGGEWALAPRGSQAGATEGSPASRAKGGPEAQVPVSLSAACAKGQLDEMLGLSLRHAPVSPAGMVPSRMTRQGPGHARTPSTGTVTELSRHISWKGGISHWSRWRQSDGGPESRLASASGGPSRCQCRARPRALDGIWQASAES